MAHAFLMNVEDLCSEKRSQGIIPGFHALILGTPEGSRGILGGLPPAMAALPVRKSYICQRLGLLVERQLILATNRHAQRAVID